MCQHVDQYISKMSLVDGQTIPRKRSSKRSTKNKQNSNSNMGQNSSSNYFSREKTTYQPLEDEFTLDTSRSLEEILHDDQEDTDEDDDDDDCANLIHAHSLPMPTFANENKESFCSITLEIMFPFIIAGMGMVGAGLVLDIVQHWEVFEKINELFILVPALLGLKGNLEMTLASRLSTQANMGKMDDKNECTSLIVSNLALVQCQGIVVGFVASMVAVAMDLFSAGAFDFDHALLLCASAIVTASIASFALGLVMVGVILFSRKCKVNPDNVATPIAASLGDLITLSLLSWIASLLFADIEEDRWLSTTIIATYVLFTPVCIYFAKKHASTIDVLYYGWTPVLLAMTISSLGGLILDKAVNKFHGIAVFQPVFNGVGGNLVAVQASRISTYLHSQATFGTLPPGEDKIFIDPIALLIRNSVHTRTCRILMMLVIPGHLLFAYTIAFFNLGHTSITSLFILFYIPAAVLQIWILLHTAHWMIHLMWIKHTDPDNSAIPYLTALGDLLGGGLLAITFELLYLVGDRDNDVGD